MFAKETLLQLKSDIAPYTLTNRQIIQTKTKDVLEINDIISQKDARQKTIPSSLHLMELSLKSTTCLDTKLQQTQEN